MLLPFGVAFISFMGGFLSGMAGFGALILMVPALIMLIGLEKTVPLGVLCGFSSQMLNTYAFRAHIQKDAIFHMLLASLPGIWIGLSLLRHMPETVLRAALGVLLTVYVLWSLFSAAPSPERPPARIWIYVAGFFSGAFGAAFGINGPPAVVYATRTGWRPGAIRAFIGCFSALLFVFVGVTMFAKGMLGREIWELAVFAVPGCLAGNVCGRRVAALMKAEHYMRLVFSLLFIMGLTLCWPAFRMYILA